MKLWTMNRILTLFGFVIVVSTGGKETQIWIERIKTYDKRCEQRSN